MSITTALEARRDALREREAGFTLIELLVVVIIIGILAAIAIPIYLGVTNGAKDSSTKSDLTNAKTAITGYAVDANGYIPAAIDATGNVAANTSITPNVAAVDLTKYGWSKSANTTSLTYAVKSGTANTTAATWCVDGVSATNAKFRISTNTSVASGDCTTLTEAKW
ncbi:type II secretion system protein [Amnibacterium endophyticum]|uniref:Type II secretion system protein n=1 Tax=Amnibacterium endophyticum TaxID=2109337 RepID=A0ABW4LEJ0_9MICO